jgi:hypothetical protein
LIPADIVDFSLLLDTWAHQILENRERGLFLKTLPVAKIL